MAVDFSQDIKTAERQMNRYVRNGQIIPKGVVEHYTNLLSGTINAQTIENGQAGDFPSGDLNATFASVNNTNDVILAAGQRGYVLVQNVGDETIYINFNAPAANQGGLQLLPGASWSTQFPQFATAEINAITVTGSSAIVIYTIG